MWDSWADDEIKADLGRSGSRTSRKSGRRGTDEHGGGWERECFAEGMLCFSTAPIGDGKAAQRPEIGDEAMEKPTVIAKQFMV